MNEIKEITEKIIEFRDKRNWKQFHNSKDLALALSIEAAELNEVFLWKKHEEADVERIKEELADVLTFALLLANNYKLNVKKIIEKKFIINNKKYPVTKSKNSAKKYNEP